VTNDVSGVDAPVATTFHTMWEELAALGRDPRTGGYHRLSWTPAERTCVVWFREQAARRDLVVDEDGNGNLVAWWWPDSGRPDAVRRDRERPDRGRPDRGVVTGSHLDSVREGGAYDGALGVVSALAAVDVLRTRGVRPRRPLGVAVFVEEEGARFGVPCLGSRLMTGALPPDEAARLRDAAGTSLVDAMRQAGHRAELGPSLALLRDPVAFVELHVEQGRQLADLGAPVGLATSIWPHGRWRFEFTGEANHAGTTAMEDRHDPMVTYAMTALAANKRARLLRGRARATFGRVEVEPNQVNAVPSRVRAWLDARAADGRALDTLVRDIHRQAADRAGRDGTRLAVERESRTPAVEFDHALRDRLREVLVARPSVTSGTVVDVGEVPLLATQAGHDAGILASAGVPAAMLFVRNPTGVSHAPAEYVEPLDQLAGVEALAAVLADLLTR
jgi:N-carbamoyl-L-amino-acid hydrolase